MAVLGLGLAGCGSSTGATTGAGNATPSAGSTGTAAPLRLSGPDTDITVVIPAGWHQVIDSAEPAVAEMVAPTSCAGSNEVACALALARLANVSAASARAAAQGVQQAVDSGTGVSAGATISQGPRQVAGRAGYLVAFRFSNASGTLTAQVATVPTQTTSASPDATGTAGSNDSDHQFAVVLVWASAKTGAPDSQTINQIIDSAAFTGSPA